MGIEELLQLLVGIVDAQLLKRVGLENFKAKDIQNADGSLLASSFAHANSLVDTLDKPGSTLLKKSPPNTVAHMEFSPVKELLIDKLGHSVTSSRGLCSTQGDGDIRLTFKSHNLAGQTGSKSLWGHLQHGRSIIQSALAIYLALTITNILKNHISQVQDSSNNLEDAIMFVLLHLQSANGLS